MCCSFFLRAMAGSRWTRGMQGLGGSSMQARTHSSKGGGAGEERSSSSSGSYEGLITGFMRA